MAQIARCALAFRRDPAYDEAKDSGAPVKPKAPLKEACFMNRTILIRGRGKAELKPDWVELPVTVSAKSMDYEQTLNLAAEALDALGTVAHIVVVGQGALQGIGFKKEDAKTMDFRVDPVFESEQDERGVYRQVFAGYECRHALKVSFPLTQERLGRTLQALAACPAKPEFSVQFTVRDQDAVKDSLLAAAAEDARKKALTLCAASGVSLGRLINISYQWTDRSFYSESNVMLAKARGGAVPAMAALDFTPNTISVSDDVAFIWEIQ